MNESTRIQAVVSNVAKKSRALVVSRLTEAGFSTAQDGESIIATAFGLTRDQAESAIRIASDGAAVSMQGHGVLFRMIGNGA